MQTTSSSFSGLIGPSSPGPKNTSSDAHSTWNGIKLSALLLYCSSTGSGFTSAMAEEILPGKEDAVATRHVTEDTLVNERGEKALSPGFNLEEFTNLVHRLDSDLPHVRETASGKLAALGDEAVPEIMKILTEERNTLSIEQEYRLVRIVHQAMQARTCSWEELVTILSKNALKQPAYESLLHIEKVLLATFTDSDWKTLEKQSNEIRGLVFDMQSELASTVFSPIPEGPTRLDGLRSHLEALLKDYNSFISERLPNEKQLTLVADRTGKLWIHRGEHRFFFEVSNRAFRLRPPSLGTLLKREPTTNFSTLQPGTIQPSSCFPDEVLCETPPLVRKIILPNGLLAREVGPFRCSLGLYRSLEESTARIYIHEVVDRCMFQAQAEHDFWRVPSFWPADTKFLLDRTGCEGRTVRSLVEALARDYSEILR